MDSKHAPIITSTITKNVLFLCLQILSGLLVINLLPIGILYCSYNNYYHDLVAGIGYLHFFYL